MKKKNDQIEYKKLRKVMQVERRKRQYGTQYQI